MQTIVVTVCIEDDQDRNEAEQVAQRAAEGAILALRRNVEMTTANPGELR